MKNKKNNRLLVSIQIINVFIGVILTLIFGIFYLSVDSQELKVILSVLLIICVIIVFINLYLKIRNEDVIEDKNIIDYIELVNVENEVIKKWSIKDKVSLIIGKQNNENEIFIDLKDSIYSHFIENNHAVLNFAYGKWYIEDLSIESRVSIKKNNDGNRYRVVKNTPCSLEKGDIIYISKVKLLLK